MKRSMRVFLSTKYADCEGRSRRLQHVAVGRGLRQLRHGLTLRLFLLALELLRLGDSRLSRDGAASRSRASAPAGADPSSSAATAAAATATALGGPFVSVAFVSQEVCPGDGQRHTLPEAFLPREPGVPSRRRSHLCSQRPELPRGVPNHPQSHRRRRTGPP